MMIEMKSTYDGNLAMTTPKTGLSVEEKVASLFQPDTLIPAQYFETFRRKARLEPEKRLMLAVLEDAVACFQKYIFARDRKGKALFRDAEEWIKDNQSDWLFSFENICEVLAFNPQYVRQGLMRWKRRELSGGSKAKIYHLALGAERKKRRPLYKPKGTGYKALELSGHVMVNNPKHNLERRGIMQTQHLSQKILAVLTLVLVMSWSAACAIAQQKPEKSLYERLGRYDAIAAVVDEFLSRAANDKQLSRFLIGLSTDSKRRLRQLIVDQLCEATGGPCLYTGRATKAAHTGLGITESDWQITVKYLAAIMDQYNVPSKEKDEFLALASTLKKDIVEK